MHQSLQNLYIKIENIFTPFLNKIFIKTLQHVHLTYDFVLSNEKSSEKIIKSQYIQYGRKF